MLEEASIQKLNTYFGFAMKKRAVYVGMKLEEMLVKKKISLLLLLPSCSEKNEKNLRILGEKNPQLHIFRYQGKYEVKDVLGYEKLNAVGIADYSLGEIIEKTLKSDTEHE